MKDKKPDINCPKFDGELSYLEFEPENKFYTGEFTTNAPNMVCGEIDNMLNSDFTLEIMVGVYKKDELLFKATNKEGTIAECKYLHGEKEIYFNMPSVCVFSMSMDGFTDVLSVAIVRRGKYIEGYLNGVLLIFTEPNFIKIDSDKLDFEAHVNNELKLSNIAYSSDQLSLGINSDTKLLLHMPE